MTATIDKSNKWKNENVFVSSVAILSKIEEKRVDLQRTFSLFIDSLRSAKILTFKFETPYIRKIVGSEYFLISFIDLLVQ